eukprot:TRINITY_DN8711_c1_g1_i1.p1 TRINITY_DN8711_c1_g1~~TRINITY_DN8711_c1_g1_i1.p1  ORF type:complete len:327 (+),score=92.12 TRINITY_DN8711_c1_g1_i1:287-1267(+)
MGSISTIFSRKHFPVVQGAEYLICAVSDGMKFMFFVCEEGVFLVDKKFNFFELECSGMEMFSREKGRSSLLEGELVNDKKTHKVVFYFSDAIQINGEYCAHANFTERLNLILSKIISCQKTKTTPFELNKKRFYSKADIGKLIKSNIVYKNATWWYQDEKRCYSIQSILFKPNEPFPLLSTKQIFEKRLVMTAHFWIRNRENHYALSVLSDFGETEFKEVAFNNKEITHIENYLSKRKNEEKKEKAAQGGVQGATVPVITCKYAPQLGEWSFVEFPKKMRPSKARSVLELLLAVAENVKEDELMYRVPRKAEEDDWWKEKKIDVNE